MKRLLFLLLIMTGSMALYAQAVNWEKLEKLQADNILIDPAAPPAKVLLLGTFHFAYPNLDTHKTDSSRMVDVLSDRRQREIRQLLDAVAAFRPNRIYIEMSTQRRADSLYKAYREGRYALSRDEIDQLALRLAKELQLPQVYAVDASSFADEHYKRYPLIDSMWNSRAQVDPLRDAVMDRRYKRFYDAGDSLEMENTMLETFLLMAEPLNLRRMYGAYLTGGFNTSDNSGPDILAMWWYDRNLRIFNNILKTKPASGDRIMVLFGNGHIPILRHCFESSPEFELVELKDLVLKGKQP
jgi:hypothetical protein